MDTTPISSEQIKAGAGHEAMAANRSQETDKPDVKEPQSHAKETPAIDELTRSKADDKAEFERRIEAFIASERAMRKGSDLRGPAAIEAFKPGSDWDGAGIAAASVFGLGIPVLLKIAGAATRGMFGDRATKMVNAKEIAAAVKPWQSSSSMDKLLLSLSLADWEESLDKSKLLRPDAKRAIRAVHTSVAQAEKAERDRAARLYAVLDRAFDGGGVRKSVEAAKLAGRIRDLAPEEGALMRPVLLERLFRGDKPRAKMDYNEAQTLYDLLVDGPDARERSDSSGQA